MSKDEVVGANGTRDDGITRKDFLDGVAIGAAGLAGEPDGVVQNTMQIVHSIMINRWNYGYAHELSSVFDPSLYGPWDEQPHRIGARPFENVAIACSDSEAFAYTHSAINEGFRAVTDLPGSALPAAP
jgi:hypothetical protein